MRDALALLFVQMAYEHPNRNFTHLVAGCMGALSGQVSDNP